MHYVCSDIHGQYGLFKDLLQKLELQDSDTLYILGDAIDRGPDSVGLLLDIMERPNVELFLGNHELMMLDHYAGSGIPGLWFRAANGGSVTEAQMAALTGSERHRIREYVRNSLVQAYIEVDGIEYALHHSYWIPEYAGFTVRYCDLEAEAWDKVFKAVWYSPYRPFERVSTEEYEDRFIHVFGHVPVQLIPEAAQADGTGDSAVRPPFTDADGHIYNIDGGCALIGVKHCGGLYCMSLETGEDGRRKEIWCAP